MKLSWYTDLHLDSVDETLLSQFLESIRNLESNSILISGDIAEGDTILQYLQMISTNAKGHVYFVLGNHDFYKDAVSVVQSKVSKYCGNVENLTWLTDVETIQMTPTVGLLGHDSWADGRYGNYLDSNLILSDFLLIKEFNPWLKDSRESQVPCSDAVQNHMLYLTSFNAKQKRLDTMQSLADQAAAHLNKNIVHAFEEYEQVIFLTHVPPFREVCLNEGKLSDEFSLPHFTCKAVGDALLRICKTYPKKKLLVLCGHTHSEATAQILPNLRIHCGGARYGFPKLQSTFELK